MSVTKYYCKKDETWYWRVYVQKQSSQFRYIREQKCINKISEKKEDWARSQEVKWKIKLAEIVAKREAQNCCWDDLIDRWETHYKNYPTNQMNSNTIADHVARLRSYTKDWLNQPCNSISVGDAYELFERLKDKGVSEKHRVSIKGSISKVYLWGLQRKYIIGVDFPPVHGIEIETDSTNGEEKKPEILTKEEISLLLLRASQTKHPWYAVWKFDLYSGLRPQELNGLRKQDIVIVPPSEARKREMKLPKSKINYGHIDVRRQFVPKLKNCTGLKGKYWRTVPINSIMYWWLVEYLPTAKFGKDKHGERVFPVFKEFDRGHQAMVLRAFCESQGLKSIKHHTLRACWATQVLQSGESAANLMYMGGWRDYETMMIYIRLAGLETVGATQGLNFEADTSIESNPDPENLRQHLLEDEDIKESNLPVSLEPNNVISLFAR